MPTYAYICRYCGWEALEFYKSLPADTQAPIVCRGCGKSADRNFVKDAGAGVFIGNAASEGVGASKSLSHTIGGKAFYEDGNGKKREVRTVRDVDKWAGGANNLGKPIMVERRSKLTGQQEWVPARERDGTIKREGERLVALPGGERSTVAERQDILDERGVMKPRADTTKNWGDADDAAGMLRPNGQVVTE